MKKTLSVILICCLISACGGQNKFGPTLGNVTALVHRTEENVNALLYYTKRNGKVWRTKLPPWKMLAKIGALMCCFEIARGGIYYMLGLIKQQICAKRLSLN